MKKVNLKAWGIIVLCFSLILGAFPVNPTFAATNGAASSVPQETVHNNLINPNFDAEVSTFTPNWSEDAATAAYGNISLSTDYARTGNNSLLFQDTESGAQPVGSYRMLSEPIPVTAGDTVTFSTYVYKAAAADQSHGVQPVIHYYKSDNTEVKTNDFLNYGAANVPVGEWFELKLENKVVPANTAYIKVGIYSGFINKTKVYVDDASVNIAPSGGSATSVELVNASFELPIQLQPVLGWSTDSLSEGNGSISISDKYAKSGTQSLLFIDNVNASTPAGSFRVLSNAIEASPGETVTFSTYVYRELDSDQTASILPVIHYYNEAGDPIRTIDNKANEEKLYSKSTIKSGQWNELILEGVVPDNTAYIKVGLYSGYPSLTKVYMDNASVTFTAAPAPSPSPSDGAPTPTPTTSPTTPPAAEQPSDALLNPSFDLELVDGAIPGWIIDPATTSNGTMELSTAYAKTGANSLLFWDKTAGTSSSPGVPGTGHFRVLSNPITAAPGEEIKLSIQVYREKLADQSHGVQPIIVSYTSAGSEIKQDFVNYGNGALTDKEWNELTVSAKAPAGTAYIKVGIYSGFPSLTKVFVDDIELQVGTPPALDLPTEIVNPSFEEALVDGAIPGWSLGLGAGDFNLSSEVALTGSKSLYFKDSSTTSSFKVVSDKFLVTPGDKLVFSSNVYVISQTHNIVPQIYYYDAADTQVGVNEALFSSNSLGVKKWSTMRVLSEVPAKAAYARVYLYSGEPSVTEAYFDDISISVMLPEVPLDRTYEQAVDLGEMVYVNLGQAGAIQTNANGENEAYFVTNGKPGKFFAVNGETGAVKFEQVIPNTIATWAMTIGSDKNVYFSGTEDGILYRYLPVEKKIDKLGYNTADNWVWDLETIDILVDDKGTENTSDDQRTEGLKIYGGTYNSNSAESGKIFEYDVATGIFRNYGVVEPGKQYVRGIAVDEKYIYAGVGTQSKLYRINRVTGDKEEIALPGYTGQTEMIQDIDIYGGKLFIYPTTNTMAVLDLKTLEVEATFQHSNNISEPAPYNSNLIYFKYLTKFYQYDISAKKTTEIELPVPLPDTARVKDYTWITMNSGEKAGQTVLAMITAYGEYILVDPTDQWVQFIELAIEPQPVNIQSLQAGFDGRLYMGGYQRGMSIYNPFTSTIDVNISSFAQPEGIGFLNDKVWYGTYVGAIMYSYDPTKEVVLNENPKIEYDIAHQDRPFAIEAADNKLFVGTVPDYGYLGGSLAVYDEASNSWAQFDQVVHNQSIIGLAYRNGLLYGSTTVWGGLGSESTEKEAKIFVWDVNAGQKIEEISLSDLNLEIDEVPRMIGGIKFGPDGLLWGVVDGTIFAMNVETKEIVKSKMIYPSVYNSSKWMPYELHWAPDGLIYTTLSRKVIAIDPETLQHKVIVDSFLNSMTLGIDGSIYFAPGAGTNLSKIAVPQTDATLSSLTVNGAPISGFSPGVLKYKMAPATGVVAASATQSGAVVTVEDLSSTTGQTIIHVVGTDGISSLTYTITWNSPVEPTPTPEPTPTSPTPTPAPSAKPVFNSDVIDLDETVNKLKAKIQQANESNELPELSDVQGHWAAKTIEKFVKLQSVSGYEDGSFRPNGDITRAEFVTFITRIFDIKQSTSNHSGLNDVNGHWAKEAIELLTSAKIINGYNDGTFRPNQKISREEIVVILSRIMNFANANQDSNNASFNDLSTAGSYAVDAIKDAAQAGVIQGKSAGTFDPKGKATRAEALTILLNALNLNADLKALLDSIN